MEATIATALPRQSAAAFLADSLQELWAPHRGNVPALDAARAIAVLLVIASHFAGNWLEAGAPHLALVDWPVFVWGWTGVDLFFVLSGLLIGQQLWREYLDSSRIDVARFLIKRTLRIWPLYFATLAALALLPLHFTPRWPDITFLSNYVTIGYVRGWSLSTEEQFYLLAPAIFLAVGRRGPRWAVAALTLGIVGVLLARGVTAQALMAQGLDLKAVKDQMAYPFHLHSEALFLGLLLAFVTVRWPGVLAGRGGRVAAVGAALTVLGLLLRRVDGAVFNYLAVGLLYTSFVAWLLADRSVVSAPFKLRIFYPLSRLSFGMYLNHFIIPGSTVFFIEAARNLTRYEPAVYFLALLGCLAQSVLLALVTFVLVERPGLLARSRALDWYGRRGLRLAPRVSE